MKTTNMLARFERKIDLYKTITLVNLQLKSKIKYTRIQ